MLQSVYMGEKMCHLINAKLMPPLPIRWQYHVMCFTVTWFLYLCRQFETCAISQYKQLSSCTSVQTTKTIVNSLQWNTEHFRIQVIYHCKCLKTTHKEIWGIVRHHPWMQNLPRNLVWWIWWYYLALTNHLCLCPDWECTHSLDKNNK